METLRIAGTRSTPEVLFDHASGELSLSGESYPENSFEYFRPLLAWVSRLLAVHTGPVTLNVRLRYLNTGSTKCMMDILDLLEDAHLHGKHAVVNWYCDEEDDRARETAAEFSEEMSLPFLIHPVREEA